MVENSIKLQLEARIERATSEQLVSIAHFFDVPGLREEFAPIFDGARAELSKRADDGAPWQANLLPGELEPARISWVGGFAAVLAGELPSDESGLHTR